MATARKLCIFDKDGTLTTPKSGKKFVQNPEDQELINGVAHRIEELRENDWLLAIATNQGGVDAGFKSLGEAISETEYAMQLTDILLAMLAPSAEEGGLGAAIEVCETAEHILSTTQKFRKPSPGMLNYIADQSLGMHTDKWERLVYVGDRPEDKAAAQAAGFEFVWAEQWIKEGIPDC